MKALKLVSLIITILGGLNWLSVGAFEYDVVSEIFGGADEVGSKIIYIIVGVASILSLAVLRDVAKDD
ncbi:DUF378 domain-containing protein [Cohnella panacarvi]|uniref:DUF378 domain-containing protein n=1 Tax=Cohnella panacarvi TaxID=400776 RepID=UPI0004792ECE|nr:DUF378 domain-containing protein [Cohnella panacarvi]